MGEYQDSLRTKANFDPSMSENEMCRLLNAKASEKNEEVISYSSHATSPKFSGTGRKSESVLTTPPEKPIGDTIP